MATILAFLVCLHAQRTFVRCFSIGSQPAPVGNMRFERKGNTTDAPDHYHISTLATICIATCINFHPLGPEVSLGKIIGFL
jgi:hypothetical protein